MAAETCRAGSIFPAPLDVLVLMGGPSSEREVSLLSGAAVADALAGLGHRVRRSDIGPSDAAALDGPDRPDVVFIALHGEFGEDGQVQRLCEDRGLAYVGSGPKASELGMDKAASKQFYRRAGLRTPDWRVIEEFDAPARRQGWLDEIGLPCVVKPLDGGSSVDVVIAPSAEQRDDALAGLLVKYGRAMVERFVKGREMTVGVLGDGIGALPVIEIRPKRAFYNYQAKYFDDDTEYLFDHGLSGSTVAALQEAAVRAHDALGCRDLSRTDFLLDEAGVAWVLETNTIPGFTSHSLVPKAAAKAGLTFATLCERLCKMALERAAGRNDRRLWPIPNRSVTQGGFGQR